MALERELAGRKYVSGIKGSIIVEERWEAREEVVVRMVQGTIHPFGLSAIKSRASLFIREANTVRDTRISHAVHSVGIYRSAR